MTMVSILVAAYNAELTLPKCLESLLGQTLRDIEVLCVDDGSTDGTLHVLNEYRNRDSRVKVFHCSSNQGQARARNLALENATGQFVCMVDADDWLSADALQAAVDVFERYPQTDCVMFHLMEYFDYISTGNQKTHEITLPADLIEGKCLTGREAFSLCIDGWKLHGIYVTRTALHKKYPYDTTTRLYSDDNASPIHFLHSREVRTCKGTYFYRKHISLTSHFNILHFDYIEANFSLRRQLIAENVGAGSLKVYERHRWENFVVCYRKLLKHEKELTKEQRLRVKRRFATLLPSFNSKDLPSSLRYKIGYIHTTHLWLFDLQQRLYLCLKPIKDKIA